MVSITSNRQRPCKDTRGGIKAAYLAPYRKFLRSEVTYDGASIIAMPTLYVYKFDLVDGLHEQQPAENEGGKYYDTALNLKFNKITAFDNLNFQKMLRKDYFIVTEDRNGNFFLQGFRNGLTADSLDTDVLGYELKFSGQEEDMAPFVTDIMNIDIVVVDGTNYVFQDGVNFIFQDDKNYIFQK